MSALEYLHGKGIIHRYGLGWKLLSVPTAGVHELACLEQPWKIPEGNGPGILVVGVANPEPPSWKPSSWLRAEIPQQGSLGGVSALLLFGGLQVPFLGWSCNNYNSAAPKDA